VEKESSWRIDKDGNLYSDELEKFNISLIDIYNFIKYSEENWQ